MSIWDTYKDVQLSPYTMWGGLFGGGGNPADSAMPYFDQASGALSQYMSPYINAGNQALPGLQDQYGRLMNDPGGRVNQIGGSYQQSPGFQFALQQALGAANRGAAAGGMAGSPANQQQNMGIATQLANQDYNQWLQNALGQYDVGLRGQQGIYNTGAQAGMGLGQDLASILAQKGQYAYAGQAGQNAANSQMWGNILGAAGSVAPFFL